MSEQLKFKNFQIAETKASDDGGMIIKGYGAFFDNIDSYGDVIKRGAFAETIEQRKGRIAFCYQHDIWNPIGKIKEISEDDKGLYIEVKLSAAEKDIQTKVKEGILQEMSIGYRTMSSEKEVLGEIEVNALTKIMLFEISLVTIAANPLARVEGMKSEQQKDYIKSEFDRLLAIVRNENIKYEIDKLKSIVLSVQVETRRNDPPKEKSEKIIVKPFKLG
jgi:hypothetical protein